MPHNNTNAPALRPEVLTRPKLEGGRAFVLSTPFQPAGDQPTAIAELAGGIRAGDHDQVLLGATAAVISSSWVISTGQPCSLARNACSRCPPPGCGPCCYRP